MTTTTVRCRVCNLPYNELNPRGCPRCAQERTADSRSQAAMMRELARASRRVEDIETPPPSSVTEALGRAVSVARAGLRSQNAAWIGVGAALGLILLLVWVSRPTFVEEFHPAEFTGETRPFAVNPGQPVGVVHSILGVQPPRPHPDDGSAERYSYGTDLVVDAINGTVYSISLALPNRSWRGLRAGMSEQEASGTLALLSRPQASADNGASAPAEVRSGYQVYRSLEARPLRTLTAEVRPPNGCFDAVVDIQPRAIGVLRSGDRRDIAVARQGESPTWMVSRVQVIDRSRRGPLGTAAC